MFTFAANAFISALNALATENKVNVPSNPSIMTSENKKAVINVSTSVPIVTSQQASVSAGGSTGNSITQGPEQGTVSLDVKQEVNDFGEKEPPPINSPRIKKREAETSVVLLNNQTPILGGHPLPEGIPVLGYLFGSTEEKIERTELLILITPRVVGTAADAARITEQMRRGSPEIEQSFKLAPQKLRATLKPLPTPPPSRQERVPLATWPSSPSEALEHAPPGCSS